MKTSDSKKIVRINPPENKNEMKAIGGSRCDSFNLIVINQAVKTMWTAHSDAEAREVQHMVVIARRRALSSMLVEMHALIDAVE